MTTIKSSQTGAHNAAGSPLASGVKYLLSDWQGSTRAVVSNSGFVNARTDYTAFGEDINAGTGLRTATQGFGVANDLGQKYGLTERDDSTGLDHTWFRKNEHGAGRWTSPDPYNGSMNLAQPQSFNRYSYVESDPVNYVDPSGLWPRPSWNGSWDGDFLRFLLDSQTTKTGNSPGGGTNEGGRGGGGNNRDNPCDVIYPVFPMRSKEWTGIMRKANTEYRHQFATATTADLIRQIGADWANSMGGAIRVGDISLKFGVDTPDHKEHQKGNQLDIGLFVTGGANVGGVNYNSPNYDQASTAKLVGLLRVRVKSCGIRI